MCSIQGNLTFILYESWFKKLYIDRKVNIWSVDLVKMIFGAVFGLQKLDTTLTEKVSIGQADLDVINLGFVLIFLVLKEDRK